jgi:nucleoside-diphosphate-sugar epimerase
VAETFVGSAHCSNVGFGIKLKGESIMKVLVTGGTGFIGSRLIERLRRRGDEVICVAKDRLNAAFLESLNVPVILGDLNNGIGWDAILDGVDSIYHLAGVTRAKSWNEYYEGNYHATKRLVEICIAHCTSLKRFVYVSSLAAVGPSPDGEPVTEETRYHPVSHYGKSKMLGEMEVVKARDRLPITVVRPSAVYGPRERDMYKYMRLILVGIQPLIGFRRKLLSLIHSDDLVDGILLTGEHPHAVGEKYFLGSEVCYSIEDIGDAIARAVQKKPMKVRMPHALVYTAGVAAEVFGRITRKQTFFNLQKARESVQTAWTCSVEKARTQLGFRQKVSLEDGMLRTYLWYCDNGWF